MRIALIVNNYPPMVGGIEYHEENLAAALAELGHQVWVLNLAGPVGWRQDGAVKVLTGAGHLPISDIIRVPNLGSAKRIAKFLKAARIDIVSTHTRFFPMSYVGQRAARMAGIPVIHTEHGSGFVASTNPIIWLGSRLVDLTVGRAVLRGADRVLGVSQEVVDFVARLAKVDADVFHNAITAPTPGPRPDRPNRLVFVGRMVAGKGWDTFIEALSQLRQDGHDVEGILLGAGADLEAARLAITDAGLTGIVSAPGRVSPEVVRAQLAGATLVNPTVLSEGFQTTLPEAISEAGRVVTYPVPGAQLLKDMGAPVRISAANLDSLVSNLREILDNPPPPLPATEIAELTWPHQSAKFARICGEVALR